MPLTKVDSLPRDASGLTVPGGPHSKLFVVFISSNDPSTGQSWCPDVRAALPHIKSTFEGHKKPEALIVEVGQRPEWKKPDHIHRKQWNVHNVPTVVRFEKVDGKVTETGRLVEDEILSDAKLTALLESS